MGGLTSWMMKRFWNSKAVDDAPFYIAAWRDYGDPALDDFFISKTEAMSFITPSGYCPTGSDRMVEIGCGIGRMTRGFAEVFGEVHAVDVSGSMIAKAKALNSDLANVTFYETDGTGLDIFPGDWADFCFSYICFQHIPSRSIIHRYIVEAGRVLKTGGTLHCQVMDLQDPDLNTPRAILAGKKAYRYLVRWPVLTASRRLRGGPVGFESPAWTGISFSEIDARRACDEAGLDISRVAGNGTQFLWITAIKR
jgi:SAM-dependent methyltransferase